MPKPIPGLPKGHVPRMRIPPRDQSLFGSHSQESRRLMQQAEEADWRGNAATADRLRDDADFHRTTGAMEGDLMPLF